MTGHALALAAITLVAALVNGAIGYGFSSITVPFALLFLTNRLLNPALVLIEVPLNAYVLWVNRMAVPAVWRRAAPIVLGLLPGVVAGTLIVSRVSPPWLKLVTYAVLLPIILVQAAGFRRPIRSERAVSLFFGSGLGLLYSVTTISGPPLAVLLNNQGLVVQEFRAALGLVRLTESSITAVAYWMAGLYAPPSLQLALLIVPSVAIGVPVGAHVLRRLPAETFRRLCMSFDAWVVGFGLSALLRELGMIPGPGAFTVLAAVAAIDAWLLYRFFAVRRTAPNRERRPVTNTPEAL